MTDERSHVPDESVDPSPVEDVAEASPQDDRVAELIQHTIYVPVPAEPATAKELTLLRLARRTLRLAWHRRVRIRHVRLICDRLIFPPAQLELFADEQRQNQNRDNLIVAIDNISHRFGNESVRVGRTLAA